MILRCAEGKSSVEDLAVGINAVSGAIEAAGHGDRLLCAVFAFADRSGAGGADGASGTRASRVYFIYNYKRGYWYPFVPARSDGAAQGASEEQRSTERELQIKAQIGSELPIEPELERWPVPSFGGFPSSAGAFAALLAYLQSPPEAAGTLSGA
jgi:hypothetical protein